MSRAGRCGRGDPNDAVALSGDREVVEHRRVEGERVQQAAVVGGYGEAHQVVGAEWELDGRTNLLPRLTVTGEETGEGIADSVHPHPPRGGHLGWTEAGLEHLTDRGAPLKDHAVAGCDHHHGVRRLGGQLTSDHYSSFGPRVG